MYLKYLVCFFQTGGGDINGNISILDNGSHAMISWLSSFNRLYSMIIAGHLDGRSVLPCWPLLDRSNELGCNTLELSSIWSDPGSGFSQWKNLSLSKQRKHEEAAFVSFLTSSWFIFIKLGLISYWTQQMWTSREKINCMETKLL